MDDDTLDDLLARTAPSPSPEALNTALQLARWTATEERRPARRHDRRALVIVAWGTLRSRHHRARQQLRGMLQGFTSPR